MGMMKYMQDQNSQD